MSSFDGYQGVGVDLYHRLKDETDNWGLIEGWGDVPRWLGSLFGQLAVATFGQEVKHLYSSIKLIPASEAWRASFVLLTDRRFVSAQFDSALVGRDESLEVQVRRLSELASVTIHPSKSPLQSRAFELVSPAIVQVKFADGFDLGLSIGEGHTGGGSKAFLEQLLSALD